VYFSLGGSRVRLKARWVFNISAVFILSGIWHGAAWNFLAWGVLHAMYYLCEHFLGLQNNQIRWNVGRSIFSGTIVFILVTIAWIFFRIGSFSEAFFVVGRIFTDISGTFSMGSSSFKFASTLLMLCVFVVYELLFRRGVLCFDNEGYTDKLTANMISMAPMLILMGLFGSFSDNFVYFQF
jgi:D-alanyl-lipoteichoic acid acyltransferase DltB (MBOAT superfamily)